MALKTEVIKHSAAIHISNDVSLKQRQSWNVLLANAYDDLPHEELFEMPLRTLRSILGYTSRNDLHLKQLLRDLRRAEIEWDILGQDGTSDWGVAGMLAEARIVNGTVRYAYSPTLRKNLHNPKIYAKISLSMQTQFMSKYSLALYENCVDYYNMELKYGETPWLEVSTFRRLLGIGDTEYSNFKDLNYHAIKKPVKEINQKSDIFLDVEYKRERRKVVALKFIIHENKHFAFKPPKLEAKSAQISLPLAELEIDNQDLLQTLEDEFRVNRKKAIEILQTTDEFEILAALEYVRAQVQAGRVKNVGAYAVKAIEEKYQLETPTVKTQSRKATPRVPTDVISKLQREYEDKLENKVVAIIEAAGERTLKGMWEAFRQEELTQNKFLLERYEANGKQDSTVRLAFRSFIMKKYVSSEERDFLFYAKQKGHELKETDDGYTYA